MSKQFWLVAGVLLLVASAACLIYLDTAFAGRFPMPLHQLFLHWFLGAWSFVFVLPAIYAISLVYLWNRKAFGPIVIASGVLVAFLTIVWFLSVVSPFRDPRHLSRALVTTSVLANGIGLTGALALSLAGQQRGRRTMIAGAHLLLFGVLTMWAFPVFGPMDL